MHLRHWQRIKQIKKYGYYKGCDALPSKLFCVEIYNDIGDADIIPDEREKILSACSCSLKHCGVIPMKKTAAYKRAMHYRKYGYSRYRAKYFMKPNNRLQIAREVKFFKSWNNFGK